MFASSFFSLFLYISPGMAWWWWWCWSFYFLQHTNAFKWYSYWVRPSLMNATEQACMWTCCDVGLIKSINILLLLIGRNCCILSNSRCFPIRTISLNSVIASFSLSFCCTYIKCNVCRIESRKCVHMHHCMGAMQCNVRFGATTVVKRKKNKQNTRLFCSIWLIYPMNAKFIQLNQPPFVFA